MLRAQSSLRLHAAGLDQLGAGAPRDRDADAAGRRWRPAVSGGGEDQRRERDERHDQARDDDVALPLRQPSQGRVDPLKVSFERHRSAD